jgi:protein phosphatase
MVADGMGAHAVGELASKMACDLIPHTYLKSRSGSPSEAITKAFREVSSLIHTRAAANREFQGMGTTCSSLLLLPEGALIAHVGDSRVYRIRRNKIDQLSFDHSLVWELIRRNHLTPEQANVSVPKNVITRSLGPESTIEVDIEGPLDVEEGDVYLLCSDGLSGPVNDEELGMFAENFHPKDACRFLLHLANLRGGLDNITVLIVRIGPWVSPQADGEEEAEVESAPQTEPDGDRATPWRIRLADLFKGRRRSTVAAPEEEHLYRSAQCPLQPQMIEQLEELTRQVQNQAIAQAWSVDWSRLASFRREAAEAVSAENWWLALRKTGEIIAMLGSAARLHRKNSGAAGAV